MQRTAMRPKDMAREMPVPLIIVVKINGQAVRAMVDTGSQGDFMSTRLADQLKLKREPLAKPIPVNLAVTGSRSMVNYGTSVDFEYQNIKEKRYFDILNVDQHDLVLGLPWLNEHQVYLGFNPTQVLIRSDETVEMNGVRTVTMQSNAMQFEEAHLDQLREELRKYALPICKDALETGLPPLRDINHKIPFIDEKKIFSWRPSRCPEALRPLWNEKRDTYLKTGRWEYRTGSNAMPMLVIKK
ncbi:hypothetical protein EXIGLDRAFT_588389, partial [Exidia glandulosa HHB12029]